MTSGRHQIQNEIKGKALKASGGGIALGLKGVTHPVEREQFHGSHATTSEVRFLFCFGPKMAEMTQNLSLGAVPRGKTRDR